MKKAITLIAFLAFIWACENEDPCATVDCNNRGICFDGRCLCEVGFEGANCTVQWSERFVGNWNGKTQCIPDTADPVPSMKTFVSTVTQLGPTKIKLSNIGGTNSPVELEMTKADEFLPFLTLTTSTSFQFEGQARLLDANTIQLNYKSTNFSTGRRDECVATLKR